MDVEQWLKANNARLNAALDRKSAEMDARELFISIKEARLDEKERRRTTP